MESTPTMWQGTTHLYHSASAGKYSEGNGPFIKDGSEALLLEIRYRPRGQTEPEPLKADCFLLTAEDARVLAGLLFQESDKLL